jgi:hypothetical protein
MEMTRTWPPVKKQAKKHEVKWHQGLKEDRIETSTGERFCWDGRYYPSKARAEAHLRAVLKESGSTRSDSWGFRVFKTQRGWGIFARV